MSRSVSCQSADLDYEVVVVGARSAGAATAMLLARAGVRVALVDCASAGNDTVATHVLMRAGVIQLQRWGLLDRVIAAGTPAVHRTVFRYGDATTAVSLKRVAGIDALYVPRCTVLHPILVDAAAAAGADILVGISVTDVEHAVDGRVSGVVGRGSPGRHRWHGARQRRLRHSARANLQRLLQPGPGRGPKRGDDPGPA